MSKFVWDSCIFIAYLKNEVDSYDIDSLQQYLDEAQDGSVRIYASTLASVEVLPSRIKRGFGSFEQFLSDFEGAVVSIDANPNIMQLAGQLRDLPYAKHEGKRTLSTPDSIVLATAVHLQEAYGERIDAIHTYDKGKKKQNVPIIGLENWCEGFKNEQLTLIKRVTDIPRIAPIHPSPRLPYSSG